MKRAFKYDVAITAADFDALSVIELKRRFETRLSKTVFAAPRTADRSRTPAATAAVRKTIEKDARVVVVLFQRLWGTSSTSSAEAAAVKARIGKVKCKDVVVVPLDTSPIPSWLKATIVADRRAHGHRRRRRHRRGGHGRRRRPKRMTDSALAARKADDEQRARARTSFLTSQRALALINRELDSLSATVSRLCETPGTLPDGFAHEARRTPDRYTVQIGPVGLSFSWIRGRSNSIADGQLLVIEWSGQLGDQHPPVSDPRNAMPAFEHVLQPHATSPEDWQWRRADLDFCVIHDARPRRAVRGVRRPAVAGRGLDC